MSFTGFLQDRISTATPNVSSDRGRGFPAPEASLGQIGAGAILDALSVNMAVTVFMPDYPGRFVMVVLLADWLTGDQLPGRRRHLSCDIPVPTGAPVVPSTVAVCFA